MKFNWLILEKFFLEVNSYGFLAGVMKLLNFYKYGKLLIQTIFSTSKLSFDFLTTKRKSQKITHSIVFT